MKKIFITIFLSAFFLAGCGDSYDSITIKEWVNNKPAEEQEKIAEYMKKKLPEAKLDDLVWKIGKCSKMYQDTQRNLEKYTGEIYQEPEICNQTIGEVIKSANK